MATNGGLNIVRDGLVFYYDTGNTKSYKGEPTTNVLPTNKILLTSYNDHGGTHVTDTNFKLFGNATLRTTSNPAQDWNGVYITGMSSLLTVGQTYTYSFYIYFTSSDTNISYFGYGAPGFTGVQGQWNRVSTTFVATTQDHLYVCLKYSLNQPVTTYYLANLQIEQKSHATSFTTTTRTNSNSLIPLVSNPVYNIDLSNVSFNTNSEMIFDGTNDYINCGITNFDFSVGISIEVIANFTNSASWERLIDFGNGAGSNNILLSRYSTTDTLWFEIYNGATSTSINLPSGIINNKICNYTVTINGTIGSIYRDGVLLNSATFVTTPTTISRSNCYIGKSNWADEYFQGQIPIVKFYNRGLTSTEVLQNYNATKSRFT